MRKTTQSRLWGVLILLLVAILLGSCSLRSNSKKENVVYVIDAAKRQYLITNVSKDYRLTITSEDSVSVEDFSVLDYNQEIVATQIDVEETQITILPPEDGYVEGNTYSITLPANATFADETLEHVSTLYFSIAKKKVERAVFASEVLDVSEKKIETQTENTVTVKDPLDVAAGDIVNLPDTRFAKVSNTYKVTSVTSTDGKQTISFEEPKLDEVYQDLEIYKTVKVNGSNIIVNESEVISFVKRSNLLSNFFTDVSASELKSWSIKIKPLKDGVEVKVKYSPETETKDGEKKFGTIAVEVVLTYKPSAKVNIQSLDQMQMEFTNTVSVKLGFSPSVGNEYDINDLLAKVSKDGQTVDEIKKEIDELNEDLAREEPFKYSSFNLFSIKIPISGSINLFFDVGFDYQFKPLSVSMESDMGYVLSNTVGIIKNGSKFIPFYEVNSNQGSGDLKITGSVGLEAGLAISGGIELVPGSKAGFELTMGPYVELEGFSKVENLVDYKTYHGFLSVELGLQYELTAMFKANLIVHKIGAEFVLGSGKLAFLEYANNYEIDKISMGKVFHMKDGIMPLKDILITYKDLFTGESVKQSLKSTNVKIDMNGTQLDSTKEGYLVETFTEGDNEVTMRWTYKGVDYTSKQNIYLTDKTYVELSPSVTNIQTIQKLDKNVSIFKRNNLFGLIDYNGKIVLEPKYNGFTFDMNGDPVVMTNQGYYYLNDSYQVTKEEMYGWGIEEWTDYVYEKSTKKVYQYNIGSIDGDVLVPIGNGPGRYEILSEVVFTQEFDYYANQYKIEYTGKKGMINGSGKIVIPPSYDEIQVVGESLYSAKKEGKWGYIDKDGNIIIELKYQATQPKVDTSQEYIQEAVRYPSGKYIVVKLNDKYGLIDLKGNEVLPTEYDFISDVVEGKMWINEGSSWKAIQLFR